MKFGLHKVVVAFLYFVTGRECDVHGGRDGGQHGWLSNGRTGWSALGLIGRRGLVGMGASQGPTV